jgi:hypothetical protein
MTAAESFARDFAFVVQNDVKPERITWEIDTYFYGIATPYENSIEFQQGGAIDNVTTALSVPKYLIGLANTKLGRWDFAGSDALRVSRKAWAGMTAAPSSQPPFMLSGIGLELSGDDYQSLIAVDNDGVKLIASDGQMPFFLFKILVNSHPLATAVSTLGTIKQGSGETTAVALEIWNGATWDALGTVAANGENWVNIGATRTTSLPAVIDSKGYIWLLLTAAADTTLSVDYIAVDIAGSSDDGSAQMIAQFTDIHPQEGNIIYLQDTPRRIARIEDSQDGAGWVYFLEGVDK